MTVMVHDPNFPTPRIAADGHTPAPDLMAAVAEADVVACIAALRGDARAMVNADFLSRMQRTAWLINTARRRPGGRGRVADALKPERHRGGRPGRAGA